MKRGWLAAVVVCLLTGGIRAADYERPPARAGFGNVPAAVPPQGGGRMPQRAPAGNPYQPTAYQGNGGPVMVPAMPGVGAQPLPPVAQPLPPAQPFQGLPPVNQFVPGPAPAMSLSPFNVPSAGCVSYCDPCGQASCLWFNVDYLLWFTNDSRLPPLITATGLPTNRALAGVLGVPGTVTVLGGNGQNNEARSGLRVGAGFFLPQNPNLGVDAEWFGLDQRNLNVTAGSNGTPAFSRPFFNADTGVENAELVSFPNVLTGNVNVNGATSLWGWQVNGRCNLLQGGNRIAVDLGSALAAGADSSLTVTGDFCYRVDMLAGFRYLDLDERLGITETLTVPPGALFAGSGFIVADRFSTANRFAGGQIGADAQIRFGPASLDVTGKLAIGGTHETVTINGQTTFLRPGVATVAFPGGLLALPSNIGQYSRDVFAVVPEVGLKFGYQLTSYVRATLGYNFLYWNEVARPGEQIDRGLNVTQLPSVNGPGRLVGAPRPAFLFNSSDFWAHGVSFGLEFVY